MKKIITVQHTQSIHHTNGMVGSWTDWALTELGKKQAENIALKLKEQLGREEYIVYSSDLKRASETAEIISEYLGNTLIYDARLRERNLGIACGKSTKWCKDNGIFDNSCDSKPFINSESIREAWIRIKSFYDMIVKSENENIIVVSHGEILSLFNLIHLCMEVEDSEKYMMHGRSGSVSFMRIMDDNKHCIDRMGDMSFI